MTKTRRLAALRGGRASPIRCGDVSLADGASCSPRARFSADTDAAKHRPACVLPLAFPAEVALTISRS